jgi:hypothetical protein
MSEQYRFTIEQLSEIERIKMLKARYCYSFDRQRWGTWGALLADDVADRVGGGGAAFVESASRRLKGVTTVHNCHSPRITPHGPDEIVGTWSMLDYNENLSATGARVGKQGYGSYHETYIRTSDGWKIAAWRLSRIRVDPLLGPPVRQLPMTDVGANWLPARPDVTPEQLADHFAIKRVQVGCLRLIDRKDWKRLADVFATGAVLRSDAEVTVGEDPVSALRAAYGDAITVHQLHMPEIVMTSQDAAYAIWALNDLVIRDKDSYEGFGNIAAQYRREKGEWRIAEMQIGHRRRDVIDQPQRQPLAKLEGAEWTGATGLSEPSQLADLEAIAQTRAWLAERFEAKDWSSWRAGYTNDARIDTLDGAENVDRWATSVVEHWRDATVVQHLHEPELELTGPDTARAVWGIMDYRELPGETRAGRRARLLSEEEYRRVDGNWLISHHREIPLHIEETSGPQLAYYVDAGAEDEYAVSS